MEASNDRIERVLVLGMSARVIVVEASEVVAETARRHDLTGAALTLAGELVVANALMSAWIKGPERLQLQLQASEPRSAFLGEVDAEGRVRARFTPSRVALRGKGPEGMLLAIKSDAQREMYRGVTEVPSVPIEMALRQHLSTSDQVDARVRIEVDDDGARGLLIERLPDVEPAVFQRQTEALADGPLQPWFDELDAGAFLGVPAMFGEARPLVYRCRCSREKVVGMLRSLGAVELRSMREEDHGAEISCDFCREVFRFDEAELEELEASLVRVDA